VTGRPEAADAKPLPRLSVPRLRDARIRTKLGLILLIPLVAVVALGALRLVDSAGRAVSAELVRSLTAVSAEAAAVSHAVHNERMAAARMLANPEEAGSEDFNERTTDTDQAIARYRVARGELGDLPEIIDARLTQVDEQLSGALRNIRETVRDEASGTVAGAVLNYGRILDDIIAYQEAVSQEASNPELAESVRALAALAKAKQEMAQSQAVAFDILNVGVPDEQQMNSFLATRTGQEEALLAFNLAANAEQLAAVNSTIVGGAVTLSDRAAQAMAASVNEPESLISAAEADAAIGSVVNLLRTEEIKLHDSQIAFATELRDEVFQQVLVESVALFLALALAVLLAVLLARALARSLSRLRLHALNVADRELPETVARLADPSTLGENTPAQLAAQVQEPAELRSRDEIGQVAQSFTVVQRAAVRVAAEQAALRTSVSAMFLNLARRSQALVDRVISQLDEIERNEEDPKRLSRMFVLDHLATRMRRNDENLLTLAGADSSPARTEDALVADALRASQSEVEHYDRIEFGTVDTDVSVTSGAVNDVVRLVAELFDNATRFSPPDSPVICEARRLGDQVIIQVDDRGVGMSADQVQRINAWLASPPAVEVTTFRKMGLAVVSRLANRHGIRVELRCDPSMGTVVYVALPRNILVLPPSRLRHPEAPPPHSPMPSELPAAMVPPAPAAPAVPAGATQASTPHLSHLPRRSSAVVHHSANRKSSRNTWDNGGTQMNNSVDMPVAGRPLYELTAAPESATAPPQAPATPSVMVPSAPETTATVELPIFKEMEAVWFRSHGQLDLDANADNPRAGSYPAPEAAPVRTVPGRPSQAAPPPQPASRPSVPPRGPGATSAGGYPGYDVPSEDWRTAADTGWQAAAAAAQPQAGGNTQSGLPKRVPQAQLVPGSVDPAAGNATPNQRRSPEEVRGLLAAYHRGVQRGRESGGGR
jgi:signal transduction histidine kinase